MAERCRTMVDGGGASSYRCDGDLGHGVQGEPCWSHEAPRSVARRARWEEEHRAKQAHFDSGLGEFQGQAQTTAERYTDDATPVPGGGEAPVTEYPGTMATRPQATPAYDRVAKAFRDRGVVHDADPMHTEDFHNGDETLGEQAALVAGLRSALVAYHETHASPESIDHLVDMAESVAAWLER